MFDVQFITLVIVFVNALGSHCSPSATLSLIIRRILSEIIKTIQICNSIYTTVRESRSEFWFLSSIHLHSFSSFTSICDGIATFITSSIYEFPGCCNFILGNVLHVRNLAPYRQQMRIDRPGLLNRVVVYGKQVIITKKRD